MRRRRRRRRWRRRRRGGGGGGGGGAGEGDGGVKVTRKKDESLMSPDAAWGYDATKLESLINLHLQTTSDEY